jgi:hypothetical protein
MQCVKITYRRLGGAAGTGAGAGAAAAADIFFVKQNKKTLKKVAMQ